MTSSSAHSTKSTVPDTSANAPIKLKIYNPATHTNKKIFLPKPFTSAQLKEVVVGNFNLTPGEEIMLLAQADGKEVEVSEATLPGLVDTRDSIRMTLILPNDVDFSGEETPVTQQHRHHHRGHGFDPSHQHQHPHPHHPHPHHSPPHHPHPHHGPFHHPPPPPPPHFFHHLGKEPTGDTPEKKPEDEPTPAPSPPQGEGSLKSVIDAVKLVLAKKEGQDVIKAVSDLMKSVSKDDGDNSGSGDEDKKSEDGVKEVLAGLAIALGALASLPPPHHGGRHGPRGPHHCHRGGPPRHPHGPPHFPHGPPPCFPHGPPPCFPYGPPPCFPGGSSDFPRGFPPFPYGPPPFHHGPPGFPGGPPHFPPHGHDHHHGPPPPPPHHGHPCPYFPGKEDESSHRGHGPSPPPAHHPHGCPFGRLPPGRGSGEE